VRGADHDRVERAARHRVGVQHRADRGDDPAGHVGAGRALSGGEHRTTVQQRRIGIRPADVDPDPHRPFSARCIADPVACGRF